MQLKTLMIAPNKTDVLRDRVVSPVPNGAVVEVVCKIGDRRPVPINPSIRMALVIRPKSKP
jgi:hypothetical protein